MRVCVGMAEECAEGEVGGHNPSKGTVRFLLRHCSAIQLFETFQPTQRVAAEQLQLETGSGPQVSFLLVTQVHVHTTVVQGLYLVSRVCRVGVCLRRTAVSSYQLVSSFQLMSRCRSLGRDCHK